MTFTLIVLSSRESTRRRPFPTFLPARRCRKGKWKRLLEYRQQVFMQLNREVQAVIVDSLEAFGGILDIAMLTTGAVAAISMWAAGPRTPRFDAKWGVKKYKCTFWGRFLFSEALYFETGFSRPAVLLALARQLDEKSAKRSPKRTLMIFATSGFAQGLPARYLDAGNSFPWSVFRRSRKLAVRFASFNPSVSARCAISESYFSKSET